MTNRTRLVHALFIAIALVLLLAAYIAAGDGQPNLVSQVLQDLGVVVLSVTLIHVLWRAAGGEPIEGQLSEIRSHMSFSTAARDLGLVAVHARANEIGSSEWLAQIERSNHSIDLSSHTMSQLLDEKHLWEAILNRVRNGVKVRILINTEDNAALKGSGYSPAPYLESRRQLMQTAWASFEEARGALPDAVRDNLSYRRVASQTLFVSIRRFDERMYVGQYLYTEKMRNNPVLVLEGARTALFSRYIGEFEGLFNFEIEDRTPGTADTTDAVAGRSASPDEQHRPGRGPG